MQWEKMTGCFKGTGKAEPAVQVTQVSLIINTETIRTVCTYAVCGLYSQLQVWQNSRM